MYENKFLNEFERQINLQLNDYYGKLCKKSRKLQERRLRTIIKDYHTKNYLPRISRQY